MKRQVIFGIVIVAVIFAVILGLSLRRFAPRYRHENSSSGLASITKTATQDTSDARIDSATGSAAGPPNSTVLLPDRRAGEMPNNSVTPEPSLPEALRASVNASFPGYRIPHGKDIADGWAIDKSPGVFSFLCRGDFNGDGSEDAAIILISEQSWRFVIFEKDLQGEYRPAFVARPKNKEEIGKYEEKQILSQPQQLLLRTVKKGETWAPEAGDDPNLGPMKTDAIELIAKPLPNAYFASLIMFKEGKYQQVYLDPLAELPGTAP